MEAVIECVRNNHKSTPWDDAAKPNLRNLSEHTSLSTETAPVVHTPMPIDFEDVIQASLPTDTVPVVHKPMLIDFEDGIQASLGKFACCYPYAGLLEGRPGKVLNDDILTRLAKDERYVIDPVFDTTDPDWPVLPRYQITCSFHSSEQIGPDSELGSVLELAFFTDNIDSQSIPNLIQKFVAEIDWFEYATPLDMP